MLLFEAFVSKQNGTEHFEDAELAAKKFYRELRRKKDVKSSVTVDECFSILGAMMLRTGWTADVSILSKSCLVVRPD